MCQAKRWGRIRHISSYTVTKRSSTCRFKYAYCCYVICFCLNLLDKRQKRLTVVTGPLFLQGTCLLGKVLAKIAVYVQENKIMRVRPSYTTLWWFYFGFIYMTEKPGHVWYSTMKCKFAYQAGYQALYSSNQCKRMLKLAAVYQPPADWRKLHKSEKYPYLVSFKIHCSKYGQVSHIFLQVLYSLYPSRFVVLYSNVLLLGQLNLFPLFLSIFWVIISDPLPNVWYIYYIR